MAGLVLGTGSGVLAAAAVYYTISTSISSSTSSLRSELHASNIHLHHSLDPTSTPLPSSALIGPPSSNPHPHTPFTTLLRTKWNQTLTTSLSSLTSINYSALTNIAFDETAHLAQKAGVEIKKDVKVGVEEMKVVGEKLKEVGEEVGKEVRELGGVVKGFGEEVVRQVEDAKDEIDGIGETSSVWAEGLGGSGVGSGSGAGAVEEKVKGVRFERGDLRGESFTGGPEVVVKSKREMERRVEGRLV